MNAPHGPLVWSFACSFIPSLNRAIRPAFRSH
ncbi:hypothetical protein LPLAFNJD_LOCUS2272 [Methylorubrum aminovorans]